METLRKRHKAGEKKEIMNSVVLLTFTWVFESALRCLSESVRTTCV